MAVETRGSQLYALCSMRARTPCSLDYWDGRGVSTCLDLACITVARIQTALSALHRHGARCRAGAKGGARCRAAVGGPWGHLGWDLRCALLPALAPFSGPRPGCGLHARIRHTHRASYSRFTRISPSMACTQYQGQDSAHQPHITARIQAWPRGDQRRIPGRIPLGSEESSLRGLDRTAGHVK